MKLFFKLSILLFLSLNFTISYSQIKKFGKIDIDEFTNNDYPDVDAYVIFKNRETKLEFQNMEGWTLVTTVHERIKINSKEGFDNATKKIKFYIGDNKNDEIVSVKAYTYNLNDTKISKTKLSKNSIFKKNINKFWGQKVFTMPNLKPNSIIEWKYTIRSNYFYLISDVIFQYDIPIKYFSAKINIINHLKFKYKFTNRLNSNIDTKNGLKVEINNVPPLTSEPYVKNINQHRAKITFDVFASDFPNDKHRDYSKTWKDVTKSIYDDDRFGKQLKKSDYYKNFIPNILFKSKTKRDSIIAIFNFVKTKIKWNNELGKFTTKGVKKAFKDGNGNIAEINLMLTSMLREVGFKANPIILSTRNHETPYFPTIGGFNYIICGIEKDNDIILLDASDEYSSIDVLPFRVLNGLGRMIRKNTSSTFIDLTPKKISTTKQNLKISINNSGEIFGNFRDLKTEIEALKSRKVLNNKDENSLISYFEKKYNSIEIERIKLLNQNNLNKPFGISLKFKYSNSVEKIGNKIILYPLFFLQKKETLFKSETRKYPINFGYPFKDIVNIFITLPSGYKVENLPENTLITLDNKKGLFSFKIKEENNKIIINVITLYNDSIIKVEDYQNFRNLILNIIKKQAESIVLIKS